MHAKINASVLSLPKIVFGINQPIIPKIIAGKNTLIKISESLVSPSC